MREKATTEFSVKSFCAQLCLCCCGACEMIITYILYGLLQRLCDCSVAWCTAVSCQSNGMLLMAQLRVLPHVPDDVHGIADEVGNMPLYADASYINKGP
jgi:hypothetical protein